MEKTKMIIAAGDAGVYVGYAVGGPNALTADGKIVLEKARHIRTYYVAGRVGDGSCSDLAALGIELESSSVSDVVPGETVLVGMSRAVEVVEKAKESFYK